MKIMSLVHHMCTHLQYTYWYSCVIMANTQSISLPSCIVLCRSLLGSNLVGYLPLTKQAIVGPYVLVHCQIGSLHSSPLERRLSLSTWRHWLLQWKGCWWWTTRDFHIWSLQSNFLFVTWHAQVVQTLPCLDHKGLANLLVLQSNYNLLPKVYT